METLIASFLLVLAACIVGPTLPRSRRLRIILALIAVPLVYFSFLGIDELSARRGARDMDRFIKQSEQLLKEGRTETLLAVYQEYHQQARHHHPKAWAAADRANVLNASVTYLEIMAKSHTPPQ